MDKKIQYFACKITDFLLLEDSEYEIVLYGVHEMIIILLNIFTVIVFGVLWKNLLFAVVFLIDFMMLRPYAGGYHADTEFRCYLLSVVVINILLAMEHFFFIQLEQILVLVIFPATFVFAYAPVENDKNSLSLDEKEIYRKKARRTLGFSLLLLLISAVLGWNIVCQGMFCSIFLVALSLITGIIKYSS